MSQRHTTTRNPLDDVDFLARSEHRVEVLRRLAVEPRTRRDLHDETGISQPTLGRVFGDFEDRNWVERRGHEYALTPGGELVWESFTDLLDTVETVQGLGDVLQQLPTDELGLDIRELAGSTVHRPESGDAFRHINRIEELFYTATHARVLGATAAPGTVEHHLERMHEFVESDRRNEAIVSPATLGGELERADEEMERMIREGLATGRATCYLYPDDIPFMLLVADEVTLLVATDDDGVPTAAVETTNEVVRTWANETLDAYRDRATQVTPENFPG